MFVIFTLASFFITRRPKSTQLQSIFYYLSTNVTKCLILWYINLFVNILLRFAILSKKLFSIEKLKIIRFKSTGVQTNFSYSKNIDQF